MTLVTIALISIFMALDEARASAPDCAVPPAQKLRHQARSIQSQSLAAELGPLMENADGRNDGWKGVGAMSSPHNCTVNLIEPPGDCPPKDDDPAIIVTNGHCAGMATSKNVRIDEPFAADISFNHFQDAAGKHVPAKVDRILYANMTTKDVAVLRLNMTYGELKKAGVQPFKVARKFKAGSLQNVAVPSDRVPIGEKFVRTNRCEVGERRDISEGSFVWRGQLVIPCPGIGGSSGSGLYDESRQLHGLLNTGLKDATPTAPCLFNHPCELTGQGVDTRSSEDSRYGFDVTFLHDCASRTCGAGNPIDVSGKDCPLPRSPLVNTQIPSVVGGFSDMISLDSPNAADRNFQAYRMKMGPAGSTDCNDESGYVTVTDYRTRWPKTKTAGDGTYIFCSYGQLKDGTWQSTREVRTQSVRLDTKPPVTRIEPAGKILQVVSVDSTDPTPSFNYKFANSEAECAVDSGFKRPPIQWGGRGVPVNGNSGKWVCVVGYDLAQNRQKKATAYKIP